MREASNG